MLDRTGAFEYAQKMVEADERLSKVEALHWLADSEESAEMFVEEFTNEAKKELASRYPKFNKTFWWKSKSKRWNDE